MLARGAQVGRFPAFDLHLIGRVDVRPQILTDGVVQIPHVPVVLSQGKSIGLDPGLPPIQCGGQPLEQNQRHLAPLELMVAPPRMPPDLRTGMSVLILHRRQVRPRLPTDGVVLLGPSVEMPGGPRQRLGLLGIVWIIVWSRWDHGRIDHEVAHQGRAVGFVHHVEVERTEDDGDALPAQYGLLVPQVHCIALLGHCRVPLHNVGLAVQILPADAELQRADAALAHVAADQPHAQLVEHRFHQMVERDLLVLLELVAVACRCGMPPQHGVPVVVGDEGVEQFANQAVERHV
mmetsp:Transcript_26874/g.62852  ORF Transcript_26874/g.62852 Transcript_26874/m.62852 type:complete len:291 (-) Transcript_26874:373-1245(-)